MESKHVRSKMTLSKFRPTKRHGVSSGNESYRCIQIAFSDSLEEFCHGGGTHLLGNYHPQSFAILPKGDLGPRCAKKDEVQWCDYNKHAMCEVAIFVGRSQGAKL